MTGRSVLLERRLTALYARLPTLACQRRCQEACGPILVAPADWDRLEEATGVVPQTDSLRCPLLSPAGACTVYAVRPLLCRLFGLTRKMACPRGCQPSRWLTDAEATALFAEVANMMPGPFRSPILTLDRKVGAFQI